MLSLILTSAGTERRAGEEMMIGRERISRAVGKYVGFGVLAKRWSKGSLVSFLGEGPKKRVCKS